MNKLSALDRKENINFLKSTVFDLLVIGGGITGAGVALDAASRGMTVALVEKNDFASGTSSKSTKLIHGGLRYLKQFEIGLVMEVGREREILHKNAPHIVIPENMLLPIIKGGSLGRITTNIGLSVYDWLAGVKFSEWKSMLSKYATRRKEPLLRTDILKGGAIYKEYRTDDARLVIEVIKTAAQQEAYFLNYAEVLDLVYENEQAVGAVVKDKVGDQQFNITAKKIINAAGPWVDQLRDKDQSMNRKRLHLTKGIHLVVPYERLPVKQSLYFDVKDGRMIFVIPREDITYIGTTDTNYQGDIDHPGATMEDVQYLLNAVNFMMPSVQLTVKDVTSSWAGLRPLIHEQGKSPSELSRKDEIFYSYSGLLSIAGGKLTGYRKMAERIVDIVVHQLSQEEDRHFAECHTDEIKLSGGQFKDEYAVPEYIDLLYQKIADFGFSEKQIMRLVKKQGTNAESIIHLAAKLDEPEDPGKRLLKAELLYCLENEMTTNLNDFLIRRTGKLYFDRPSVEEAYQFLKEIMESKLQWSDEQKKNYDDFFWREFESVMKFK